jgi:hypothetical protein
MKKIAIRTTVIFLIFFCTVSIGLASDKPKEPKRGGGEVPVPWIAKLDGGHEIFLLGLVTKAEERLGFGPMATHKITCGDPTQAKRIDVPIMAADDPTQAQLDKLAGSKMDVLVSGAPITAEGKTVLKVRLINVGPLGGSVILRGVPKNQQVGFCYHNTMIWPYVGGEKTVGVAGINTDEQKKLNDATVNKTAILFVGTPRTCVEPGFVVRGKVLAVGVGLPPVKP